MKNNSYDIKKENINHVQNKIRDLMEFNQLSGIEETPDDVDFDKHSVKGLITESKFLRLLKGKYNTDNKHTIRYISLLVNQFSISTDTNKNIFQKLIQKLKTIKSPSQIIEDNFDFIITKVPAGDVSRFIGILLDIRNSEINTEKNSSIVHKRFYDILDLVRGSEKNFRGYTVYNFLMDFRDNNPVNEAFIQENAIRIVEEAPINELLEIKELLKARNNLVDDAINQTLENNKAKIAKQILGQSVENRLDKNKYMKEHLEEYYTPTVLRMLDEILEDQHKRWIDIKELIGGAYSSVFQIGEKIFKVGRKRETYEIPYSKRILQPLTRTNFDVNGKVIACAEICPRVKLDFDGDKEQILYELWKALFEEGIMWSDPKVENMGQLLEDNVTTLNGEEIKVDAKAVGFKDVEGFIPKGDPLEKGMFVVIDTDFIYKANDPNIVMFRKAKEFQWRYNREKQEEIAKKHIQNQKTMNKINNRDYSQDK